MRNDPSINPNFKGGEEIPCSNCGLLIYRTPSKKLSKNHFCSRNCCGSWTSKNRVGENGTNYKNAKHKSSCKVCGAGFEYYGSPRFFCNVKCMAISQKKINCLICHNCNKEYIRPNSIKNTHVRRNVKFNFCSNSCKYSFHTGENHPNWVKDRSCVKMENRRIRYSTRMKEWRLAVFDRDDFTCILCQNRSSVENPVRLNAHHIKRFCDFPDLRFCVNNGATLCVECHDEVTGNETSFESKLCEIINRTMMQNENKKTDISLKM